jgi:DNA-binding HxlR family transcriptional regulator
MTNKLRYLDQFDIYLLVSIHQGVDSCTYLATVTGKSKQSVSLRVQNLETDGLVEIRSTSQKHFKTEYLLTDRATKIVEQCLLDFNQRYLRNNPYVENEEVINFNSKFLESLKSES